MECNSVKMTDIPHQKAFEMYALEASRVTGTSVVLAVFVCSLIRFIGEYDKRKEQRITMQRHWEFDDLVEHVTLLPHEYALIATIHAPHNRLGFAVLLKFFLYAGHFP